MLLKESNIPTFPLLPQTSVSTDDTRKLPDILIPEMLKQDVNTMNTALNKKPGLCIRGCKYLSQAGTFILTNIFFIIKNVYMFLWSNVSFFKCMGYEFCVWSLPQKYYRKKAHTSQGTVLFFLSFLLLNL